jgi:hypothetical protein
MMFNGRRRIGLGSIINRLGFEGCFFFFLEWEYGLRGLEERIFHISRTIGSVYLVDSSRHSDGFIITFLSENV